MSNVSEQRWGVLGGGMLGMTLARELSHRGARVTLCEAAPELGGLAAAWQLGPLRWDRHYHVTLLSDTALRGLLTDLGLEQDLQWSRAKTGFYVDGRLVSMSNVLEYLRFPPLGLVDKFRLASTILYASRVKDWRRLEQIPVTDWLRRLCGANTFEKVWLPLLKAKLGENYKDVSAAFIWTTINRLYAARRAGMKEELFGYVRGGYARILDRLAGALRQQAVEIVTGAGCREVRRSGSGVRVELSDGSSREFDRVVLTMPAPIAATLCPELPERERDLLTGIRYQGIVCASMLLKRPLAGYYVTNITDGTVPFTGVIEMSAIVDREEFGGRSLVYLPKYTPSDNGVFSQDDGSLRREFLDGLGRIYPDVTDDDVVAFRVSRVKNVFALPTIGYSQRLPPVRTSVPGVFVLNSAQIVNGTLNVNETVLLAQRGVEMFT